jgi:hypothetical protein
MHSLYISVVHVDSKTSPREGAPLGDIRSSPLYSILCVQSLKGANSSALALLPMCEMGQHTAEENYQKGLV